MRGDSVDLLSLFLLYCCVDAHLSTISQCYRYGSNGHRDSPDYRPLSFDHRDSPLRRDQIDSVYGRIMVPGQQPPAVVEEKKTPQITVDELLCNPGRRKRPDHIVVIVRGPPGAGKTYASKLIKVHTFNS